MHTCALKLALEQWSAAILHGFLQRTLFVGVLNGGKIVLATYSVIRKPTVSYHFYLCFQVLLIYVSAFFSRFMGSGCSAGQPPFTCFLDGGIISRNSFFVCPRGFTSEETRHFSE